jgi:hypothetical protein
MSICARCQNTGFVCVALTGGQMDRDPCPNGCKPRDNVTQPAHYTKGGIECIDAIRAALSADEFRGFCKGNAIKYAWREKHKNGDEDLRKGEFYLRELTTPGGGRS